MTELSALSVQSALLHGVVRGAMFSALLPIEWLPRFGVTIGTVLLLSITPQELEPLSLTSLVQDIWLAMHGALPLAFSVSAARMAGELIDIGRGQNIALSYDPTHDPTTPVATIMEQWAWGIALAGGGLLAATLLIVAPGDQSRSLTNLSEVGRELISSAGRALEGALLTVLPLVFIFALVECSAGVIGRVVPGLRIQLETFLFKAAILGVLATALASSHL